MKSIVEEASSISKAIEKGWIRAGKPQEFTVKVFEDAEKNFFGFTTKPAKVGILFEERSIAQAQYQSKGRQPQRRPQPNSPQQQVNVQSRPTQNRPERQPRDPNQNNPRFPSNDTQSPAKKEVSPWNNDLVTTAHEWVTDSLTLMGKSDIKVRPEPNGFSLKLSFSRPVTEISDKEKLLFKGWAYLIMQTLRQKYKRPLKGLKVILTSENA